MLRSVHIFRWLRIAVWALAAASCALTGAFAAGASRIGYFQTLDGSVGFVLDRSGETPKQRYDGAPEILLLEPAPAARGDTIFRQSDGLIVLRETPYGAMTFFSRRYVKGVAVLRLSDAVALVSAPRSADEVAASANALADHLTASLGVRVPVALPAIPLSPIALGILDEAVVNTGLAFDRLLARPARAAGLAALVHAVEYRIAAKPGGSLAKATLIVNVAPSHGLMGRLASLQIESLLSGGLAAAPARAQGGAAFDQQN